MNVTDVTSATAKSPEHRDVETDVRKTGGTGPFSGGRGQGHSRSNRGSVCEAARKVNLRCE